MTDQPSWDAVPTGGALRPPSLEAVGFVHLCDAAQLEGVLHRFFRDQRDLLVLHIDPSRLPAGQLRYEAVDDVPGERFAHLYAPLPHAAVVRVEALR